MENGMPTHTGTSCPRHEVQATTVVGGILYAVGVMGQGPTLWTDGTLTMLNPGDTLGAAVPLAVTQNGWMDAA